MSHRPRIYAHRGAHQALPENTLEAFAEGLAQGAEGVELDVRLAACGEVIVFHDRDLTRFTGEAVEVASLPYAELAGRDLGGGARIPVLDDAIDLVLGHGPGVVLNVELKGDVPDRRALATAVAALLRRRSAAERARLLLSSFHPELLLRVYAERLGVPVGFLFDEAHTGPLRSALGARLLLPDGVHPHHPLIDAASVARWRARGLFINTWTVNDPEEARRLAALGVDAIITDEVPTLRAALGATGPAAGA